MTSRRDTLMGLTAAGVIAALPGTTLSASTAPATTKLRRLGPIMQHGYVVEDAAKAALQWAAQAGIGPFYLFEQPVENYVFRGEPVPLTLRIAVSYWQGIQMELIEQTSPEPSFYSQSLEKAAGKLNHYAVMVLDIDLAIADLDAANYLVHRGGTSEALTFAYLEGFLPDGTTLELMQSAPSNQAAFDGMKAISQSWDGTRPLRTMRDLMADLSPFRNGL